MPAGQAGKVALTAIGTGRGGQEYRFGYYGTIKYILVYLGICFKLISERGNPQGRMARLLRNWKGVNGIG